MPRGRPRSKFQSEPVICPYCKCVIEMVVVAKKQKGEVVKFKKLYKKE